MGRIKGVKNKHPRPVKDRFWEKVSIDSIDKCWEWTAYRNKQGYGIFGIDGKLFRSNRIVWMFAHGEIPDGMYVCHTCDNPPCCNPKHLFLGTNRDNALDMMRKGRGKIPRLRGDDCPWSKTTSEIVIEIRSLFDENKYTQTELSKMFNMDIRQIGKIVRRERWRHIP